MSTTAISGDPEEPDDLNGDESQKDESKVAGGKARAESLTPEQRKAIARKAAEARWDNQMPQATHQGAFHIGNTEIAAAVLQNGKRLLTQATFLRALGRARSPKAGTGVLTTVDGIPFFLQAEILKPFISEDLLASTTPIFFRERDGKRGVGYDAELLPQVAEVYLKLRDQCVDEEKPIPARYASIIKACDIVMRGLARVGITALVDEATGYQSPQDQKALQEILDRYLLKEFATWARTFPVEFYRHIFRLRGWTWRGMKVNRPSCVAQYTNNLVYERLAPGILTELQSKNPVQPNGRRRVKHFQFLTPDFGHPALSQHLHAITGLMRAAESWPDLMKMVDKAYPKFDKSGQLSLFRAEHFDD